MFSVVINHNCDLDNAPQLAGASIFSAALSVRDPLVREVLLVDGSMGPDLRLQRYVEQIGVRYLHSGGRLSFAEGYNFGLSHASQNWVVLCASDVFPALDCYQKVADFLASVNPDTVGCLIPRLTISDLPYQKSRLFERRTCTVPVMTLNFNVFQRTYLTAIGGVPTEYSGNYNDIELSVRIRRDGRRIYMLPVRCVHYGSLTLRSGGSKVSASRDLQAFSAQHPELLDYGSMWDLRLTSLLKPGLLTMLLHISKLIRARRARTVVTRWILRLVPLLSAHPS